MVLLFDPGYLLVGDFALKLSEVGTVCVHGTWMNLCVLLNCMERCWHCWSAIRIISLLGQQEKKSFWIWTHCAKKKRWQDTDEKLEFTKCDITLVTKHLGWDLLTSFCVNLEKKNVFFPTGAHSVLTVHFMSAPFRFILISVLCNVKRRTFVICH